MTQTTLGLTRIILFILLISQLSFVFVQCLTVTPSTGIESQNVILYNTSSTAMGSLMYDITFLTAFNTTPTVAFGISKQQSRVFQVEDFQVSDFGKNTTHITIRIIIGTASQVYRLSINYIAIHNEPNILVNLHILSGVSNVSSGTGFRTVTTTNTQIFNLNTIYALTYLTSYSLTSSTQFMVKVQAAVVSASSYTTTVSTTSDCKLSRVKYYIVFVDKTALEANGYYVGSTTSISLINQNGASFSSTISHYNTTYHLIGLSSFYGFTSQNGMTWGWDVIFSSTAGTSILQLDSLKLQSVYYSLLQIGTIVSSPSVADEPTSQPQDSGSSLIIILATVLSLLVITIVIVIFVLWRYRRNSNPIHDIPSLGSLKELPDLSF